MATKVRDLASATVQTVDATVTSIITYALPDATVANFVVNVEARRPSNGDSHMFQVGVGAKRHAGGAAALVGVGVDLLNQTDAGAATWVVAFAVSGNNVLVRVTGQGFVTIEWMAILSVDLYTP